MKFGNAEKRFENDSTTMWIKNEILFSVIKPMPEVNLEIAKENIHNRKQFTDNQKMLMFIDFRNVNYVSKEARDYLSENGSEGIIAGAFLVDNQINMIIGNFFLKVNKPKAPARLFTNENKAIRWLNTFK